MATLCFLEKYTCYLLRSIPSKVVLDINNGQCLRKIVNDQDHVVLLYHSLSAVSDEGGVLK